MMRCLQVSVNGKPIFALPQKKYYFALNKPKGCLCSNTPGSSDEGGSSNLVIDLFSDWLRRWADEHPRGALLPRLFTVGRLDVASVGLIYVTNDGMLLQGPSVRASWGQCSSPPVHVETFLDQFGGSYGVNCTDLRMKAQSLHPMVL